MSTAGAGASLFCTKDGTELVIREDDREEIVLERLKAYDRKTAPVLEFLRGQGYWVGELNGAAGTPEEISERIVGWMQRKRVESNA